MQREIYNLFADNKLLPKGTRIKTTRGGIHTGGDHELSDDLLKSANRKVNGYLPLWITGWKHLHDDLIIPKNDERSLSFDDWWSDQENGCPTLVLDNDEQFARAVWDAAIKSTGNNTNNNTTLKI